jgi:hypothetical protein
MSEALPERYHLEHQLRQQRAYALDRAGFLELVSRLYALAGIVAGGAVFAELGAAGFGKFLLGVAVPCIGAAELVFGFGKRAERGREIARESDRMLTRLDALADAAREQFLAMQAEYDEIRLPEERLHHWAMAIAWNVAARERGVTQRATVNGWRAFWCNLWPGRPDF